MKKLNEKINRMVEKYKSYPRPVRIAVYAVYYVVFVMQGNDCGDFWDIAVAKKKG